MDPLRILPSCALCLLAATHVVVLLNALHVVASVTPVPRGDSNENMFTPLLQQLTKKCSKTSSSCTEYKSPASRTGESIAVYSTVCVVIGAVVVCLLCFCILFRMRKYNKAKTQTHRAAISG